MTYFILLASLMLRAHSCGFFALHFNCQSNHVGGTSLWHLLRWDFFLLFLHVGGTLVLICFSHGGGGCLKKKQIWTGYMLRINSIGCIEYETKDVFVRKSSRLLLLLRYLMKALLASALQFRNQSGQLIIRVIIFPFFSLSEIKNLKMLLCHLTQ